MYACRCGGHLLIAWLGLLAAAVAARGLHTAADGLPHTQRRSLQDFAAQPFCPDGCAADGCTFAATSGGFKCQQCAGNLVINKITGNCACPAGKYASREDWCEDCGKGSWCAGGDYFLGSNPLSPLKGTGDEGKLAPIAVECPLGSNGQRMTTLGRRAVSWRACVNMPGSYYVLGLDGKTVDMVTCAQNTYSPGLKKQRACVPCPTGFTTNGRAGAVAVTQCVVPPGYYLKGPGQVAPCPKGEWKADIGPAGNCTKCVQGVTTLKEASTSDRDCIWVAPGWYAAVLTDGVVTDVSPCPQGYWCTGGQPSQVFDPRNPNPDDATIFRCPYNMLTVDLGATAPEQCLTPPGHYTDATGTFPCPQGMYRSGWVPYGEAVTCTACGEGVRSAKTDQITLYNIVTRQESFMQVASSSEDCYIMPGQGLYYTALTRSYRVKNCISNSYGVSNITYGLSPSPCRDCPENMVAVRGPAYPNSTRHYVKNGDAEGFASELACVTADGFGYSGRDSQPCEVGFFNGRDNRDACSPCTPYGLTTAGVGKGVSLASCGVAAGFGYSATQNAVVPCPIGTFNNASFTAGRTTPCSNCGSGLTTEREGSTSKDMCNFCDAGWGGPGCQTVCGGEGVNATYGPIGRTVDTNPNCTVCTTQATGYSFFDSAGKNDLYFSTPVSRVGANQSTDCVSKWSQLVDGAWHIQMPDNDAYSQVIPNITTFAACVELCNYDPCQFVTYDYLAKTCTRRNGVPPIYIGAPLIAFKNLPSGDVGTNIWSTPDAAAASSSSSSSSGGDGAESTTTAKLVSTGIYTFYRDELALQVGTQEDPAKFGFNITAGLGGQFLQNCLDACDDLSNRCAGITIRMNVEVADRPTTCKLISGRIKLGVHKRTVMRAEPTRMPLPSLNDNDPLPSPSPAP